MPNVENLKKLKHKRQTQRAYATRFMNTINTFNGSTDIEELEHYMDRLQEVLKNLIVLDESVHDLMDDEEYAAGPEKCEEFVDGAKRALRKADRIIRTKAEKQHRILQANRRLRTHNPR